MLEWTSEQERDSSVRLFKDYECILRRNFPTWQPNLQSNNPQRCIPHVLRGASVECVFVQMYVEMFLEYIVNIYVCTSLCVGVHIDIVGVVVTRIDLFMFIKWKFAKGRCQWVALRGCEMEQWKFSNQLQCIFWIRWYYYIYIIYLIAHVCRYFITFPWIHVEQVKQGCFLAKDRHGERDIESEYKVCLLQSFL